MNIAKTAFGFLDRTPIDQYTLTNDNGVSISVLTFAGLWREYNVPSSEGTTNIILNAPDMKNYTNNPFYLGRTVGRIAGRLKDGNFDLNGKNVQVEQNEGNNMLHGGNHGFSDVVWDAETKENTDSLQLILKQTFTEAEDKFPGTMPVTITYTLKQDNSVTINFSATTDEDTLFNPTSHVYWNLGGDDAEDILAHTLQMNSKRHLDVDGEKIPTGKFIDNAGTPFDFTQPVVLGDAIDKMQDTDEKGFDDIMEVQGDATDNRVVTLSDPASGRSLKIFSDRNAVIMFTANSMESGMLFNHGDGHPYEGIALEAQNLSDTPHHPEFGDVTLHANETKSYEIKYLAEF